MFNETSGLVKIWVRQITKGTRTVEDVPDLDNLREVVESCLGSDV